MIKRIALSVLVALPLPAQAFDLLRSTDNFESCVIDNLRNARNDSAARVEYLRCKNTYPLYRTAKPKYPLGKAASWQDCLTEYGSNTRSEWAARMIRAACVRINGK